MKKITVKELLEPHIYFLKQGDEIVYIGQSYNISGRIGTHLASEKKFDNVQYFVFNGDLNFKERMLIDLYKPKYNIDYNGAYKIDCEAELIINEDELSAKLVLEDEVVVFNLIRCLHSENGQMEYDIMYDGNKIGEFDRIHSIPSQLNHFIYKGFDYKLKSNNFETIKLGIHKYKRIKPKKSLKYAKKPRKPRKPEIKGNGLREMKNDWSGLEDEWS